MIEMAEIKPGTWLQANWKKRGSGSQIRVKHHLIAIHPRLGIGYTTKEAGSRRLHCAMISFEYISSHSISYYEIVKQPSIVEEAKQIIDTALRYYGKKKYNLVTNNCEHFASRYTYFST